MKKWLYIVAPAVMLVVFTFFYFGQAKSLAQKELEDKAKIEEKRLEEEAKRAAIEEKARLDAAKRAEEREAEAAKKEADRVAKFLAEGAEIQQATDEYSTEADRYAKEISELEIRLDTLRKQKEDLNAQVLASAKRVEQAQIDKRNAEIEIQRKTEVMVNRAEASTLAQMPAPVTTGRR